jgi:amidophosphoribosyltransferase
MCGIIGVTGTPYSSQEAYQGLLLMQHRGQDAAGILSFESSRKVFNLHKKPGLVDKVFEKHDLLQLKGETAVGHTRYSTIGHSDERDIQPLMINYPFGIGLAHNGNVVNVNELKQFLKEKRHRYIFSNNDAEVILNLLADNLTTYCKHSRRDSEDIIFEYKALEKAVSDIFEYVHGGYAVIGQLADKGLFAFRDPNGIRPLILGERELTPEEKEFYPNHYGKAYCLASESNTLNYLGYKIVRDVEAGELIFIGQDGELNSKKLINKTHTPCMFEYVYFANPESIMDKENVYATRLKMGTFLGQKIKGMMEKGLIQPDVVVPVPETSRVSAISMSEEIGVPYRELLIKNRYIQRSFILNSQASRERAVQLKLSPVKSEIKGKRVLLVDDSIVRGTTSTRLIELVRKAGAKEVYFASACSPILHPCYYGIDFPDPKELVATDKTYDEIEKALGADRVIYLDVDYLKKSIDVPNLCTACLDGEYPVDISSAENFNENRVKETEVSPGGLH